MMDQPDDGLPQAIDLEEDAYTAIAMAALAIENHYASYDVVEVKFSKEY